jgi:hypothetical protein
MKKEPSTSNGISVPKACQPEIAPKSSKRKGGPPGNQKSLKHGAYSNRLSREEEQERNRFESELIEDLGGDVSAAQRSLIRRAGFLEIRLRRCDRADSNGSYIPDEHLLAWVNSQRLLLTALGLERKQRTTPSLHEYLNQKAMRDSSRSETQ